MEIWGHCRSCGLWFVVAEDTVRALVGTRCVGCGRPPEHLEQRLGDLVIELHVTAGRSPDTPLQGVA